MKNLIKKSGSSLIEVIVAVGVFALISANVVVYYIGTLNSNLREKENLQAEMYLQQGMEAIKSIGDYDITQLNEGAYGIQKNPSNYWELTPTINQNGQYERMVSVEAINRNASTCEIVETGGVPDPDSKKISSKVTWYLEGQQERTITSEQILTIWEEPTFCITSNTHAEDLDLDLATVVFNGGGKKVVTIDFSNIGLQDIVITEIDMRWTTDNGAELERVRIESSDVWRYNGPQSPDGKQSSPTSLDNDDHTVPAGETHTINEIKFDEDMDQEIIWINFHMSDGSSTGEIQLNLPN